MTPQSAAALRLGETVNINGYVAPVSELFRATIETVLPQIPGLNYGTVFYGFTAESGATRLLVRWDSYRIEFYSGKSISSKVVAAAFPTDPRQP